MPQEYCYNCGTPLDSNNRTKEHIPAKCLYEGFGEEYKRNRITVPACRDCNALYSLIDQAVRDAIGIMMDEVGGNEDYARKSVKSILRPSNWKDRVVKGPDRKSYSVSFEYNEIRAFHIKNLKGLYLHEFGTPFPNHFRTEVITEFDPELKEAQGFYSVLNKHSTSKPSGHPDIFQYRIMLLDGTTPTNDPQKGNRVLASLEYHETMLAIVVAADPSSFVQH